MPEIEVINYVVRSPLFPLYSEVVNLIKIWKGSPRKSVLAMINAISEQTGTPQNPVDWSDPDKWIAEKLDGEIRSMALKTWSAKVNPRHSYGCYLFVNLYGLLAADVNGIYQVSEAGQLFLSGNEQCLREIDEIEGMRKLLAILSNHSPAKRGDLLQDWGDFLHARSKFGTASTITDTLRRRLLNLIERGYVVREGNTYVITDAGLGYADSGEAPATERPHQALVAAAKSYNQQQEAALRAMLVQMNPYRFESLVKDLLEAMDYDDVVVTKQSGDKGIDVVANYEFGITQIREVVQVKRQQGTINRPILDQLRGALPYYQAIRGTIITVGKFAKGCKEAALFPGAAPITLIDGDKLIELLLKHGVGIKRRNLALVEVDEAYFLSHEAAVYANGELGSALS
ncbi:MAG: restriction endonuclease [Verrucomicrobiales bacterium]